MRLLLRAVLLAALLVLCPAVSAYASVGVGIQADPVRLAGNAHPGGTFTLPDVYVVNTGSQAESISVSVERMSSASTGLNVPASWIQASSVPSSLGPGQAVRIPLALVIPGNARPGRYASDIVVTGAAQPASGSSIRFGAAAATGLEFNVVPATASGYPVWKIWLIVVVVVGTIATLVVRHSGLRIRIERSGGTRA